MAGAEDCLEVLEEALVLLVCDEVLEAVDGWLWDAVLTELERRAALPDCEAELDTEPEEGVAALDEAEDLLADDTVADDLVACCAEDLEAVDVVDSVLVAEDVLDELRRAVCAARDAGTRATFIASRIERIVLMFGFISIQIIVLR